MGNNQVVGMNFTKEFIEALEEFIEAKGDIEYPIGGPSAKRKVARINEARNNLLKSFSMAVIEIISICELDK